MSEPTTEGELVPAAIADYIDTDVLDDSTNLLSALQKARLNMINDMGHFGYADPKIVSLRLKAMKDATDQCLTVQRIAIEEQSVNTDKEIAQTLAEVSINLANNMANPFRAVTTEGTLEKPKKVALKGLDINPTTMNESATKTTYDKFMDANYKPNEHKEGS